MLTRARAHINTTCTHIHKRADSYWSARLLALSRVICKRILCLRVYLRCVLRRLANIEVYPSSTRITLTFDARTLGSLISRASSGSACGTINAAQTAHAHCEPRAQPNERRTPQRRATSDDERRQPNDRSDERTARDTCAVPVASTTSSASQPASQPASQTTS